MRQRRCNACQTTIAGLQEARDAGWIFFRPMIDFCPPCWEDKRSELYHARRGAVKGLRELARWLEDIRREDIDEKTGKWVHYIDELVTKLRAEREGTDAQ